MTLFHHHTMSQITHHQFVEKYKLIPIQNREYLTNSCKILRKKYDTDDDLNVFDNLIIILRWHQSCTDGTNYDKLARGIEKEVHSCKSIVFNDVIEYLLTRTSN